MITSPTHEDPILLLLPTGADAGAELAALCGHDAIRHYVLPSVWSLDHAVDLPATRPDLRAVTPENLPEVVDALTRICDERALDEVVARTWRSVDEMVRDHYLRRTTLQTFAAIFKLAPKSIDREPPPEFRTDRIHDHGFEVQYRLDTDGLEPSPHAPPQEGSVVYYPFDPANAGARAEAAIGEGHETVLEAFAYSAGRARHREALERIGRDRGWRVIDPHPQA